MSWLGLQGFDARGLEGSERRYWDVAAWGDWVFWGLGVIGFRV